jgi:hypothetical protein
MASSATDTQFILGIVLAAPFACLCLYSLYLQWQSRQVYKRIGDYSIGLVTYHTQFDYPGVNFPGPNILEAKISAQPTELQEHVQVVRRRIRHLRWAVLSYIGFLVILGSVISLVRKLSS